MTSTFTFAQLDKAANGTALAFTGNSGLTIGNRVIAIARSNEIFGTGNNTGPRLTMESGGYLSLNNGFTTSTSASVFSLSGAGTVTNLDTDGATSNGSVSTLTITGSDTTTFSGSLANGSYLNGALGLTTDAGSLVALNHAGSGTLSLTGTNTHTGGTTVSEGVVVLGHSTDTLSNTGSVSISGGELRLGSNSDSVGTVTISSGSITGTGGTLTASSYVFTDSGVVSAKLAGIAATLSKSGAGTVTLSGNNAYTGPTTVTSGKLVINGNISTSSLTTVQTGGTLGGSGTVAALIVDSGGTLAPGNSPGILSAGNTSLLDGSTLAIEINGSTVGSGYDQLNVTGTVSLAGLLEVSMGYTPAENTMFFILANDGNDAVSGSFDNAPANGGTYTLGGQAFLISYSGDSIANSFTGGNDVVLMVVPEPTAAVLGCLGLLGLLRRRRD